MLNSIRKAIERRQAAQRAANALTKLAEEETHNSVKREELYRLSRLVSDQADFYQEEVENYTCILFGDRAKV